MVVGVEGEGFVQGFRVEGDSGRVWRCLGVQGLGRFEVLWFRAFRVLGVIRACLE